MSHGDNVISFKNKRCGTEAKAPAEMEMFSMFMTMDEDGNYGVHMEIEAWATDEDVAEALQAAYFKFLMDAGLLVEDE